MSIERHKTFWRLGSVFKRWWGDIPERSGYCSVSHYMIQYASMHGGANIINEEMFEKALPPYLEHDLEAYKKGLAEKSSLLDCLWGELYGSINIAEINDGFIADAPLVSDLQRRFYCHYIRARYNALFEG